MVRIPLKRFTVAAIAATVALVTAGTAPASAHSSGCERVSQKVTLTPSSHTRYTVVGWLCGSRHASTVQVLNSGLTYGSYYWNLPYRPEAYSYVRAANRAGYATLNIDRIGVGASDKPPADQVDVPVEGWVNAQLAQTLRHGSIGREHRHFQHVVGVGHSLGGIIVTVAQAQYRPFDAIVVNGMMHAADTAFLASLGGIRHPAASDPKFATANLPAGYITTKPGTRHNYYTVQYADPRVIQLDEELKQTATTGEIATLGLGRDPSYSSQVKVPVLLWIGQQDGLHCNESVAGLSCANTAAITAREKSAWNSSACLGVYVQPQAGHDTSLHRTAPLGVKAVDSWLNEMGFGAHKAHPVHARCA